MNDLYRAFPLTTIILVMIGMPLASEGVMIPLPSSAEKNLCANPNLDSSIFCFEQNSFQNILPFVPGLEVGQDEYQIRNLPADSDSTSFFYWALGSLSAIRARRILSRINPYPLPEYYSQSQYVLTDSSTVNNPVHPVFISYSLWMFLVLRCNLPAENEFCRVHLNQILNPIVIPRGPPSMLQAFTLIGF